MIYVYLGKNCYYNTFFVGRGIQSVMFSLDAVLAVLRIWYNMMKFFKGERRTIYESSSRNGKRRKDDRS